MAPGGRRRAPLCGARVGWAGGTVGGAARPDCGGAGAWGGSAGAGPVCERSWRKVTSEGLSAAEAAAASPPAERAQPRGRGVGRVGGAGGGGGDAGRPGTPALRGGCGSSGGAGSGMQQPGGGDGSLLLLPLLLLLRAGSRAELGDATQGKAAWGRVPAGRGRDRGGGSVMWGTGTESVGAARVGTGVAMRRAWAPCPAVGIEPGLPGAAALLGLRGPSARWGARRLQRSPTPVNELQVLYLICV